jgi:hypothetical protein
MNKTLFRTLRGFTLVAAIVAAAVVMVACYPNGPESSEDFDVVATFYKQGADFTTFETYACRLDSIVHIEIKGAENLKLTHDNDVEILAQINDLLAERGYTREADPAQNPPDVAVLVGAAATTEYDPYSTDPWFSYWGTWFADSLGTTVDVNWGLDFSWYSGSVVYSYDVGALFVVIVDIEDAGGSLDADSDVLWMGSLNGIVSGNSLTGLNRVLKGIDQMFAQSPYLRRTGGTQ